MGKPYRKETNDYWKSEVKRIVGRRRSRWDVNFKMHVKEIVVGRKDVEWIVCLSTETSLGFQ